MKKVILAGNPNTGKTTLFNTLAGANEHASNWHGVTVDVKEKPFKIEGQEFLLCDIPGLYSLDGYSEEEKIASDFIEKNPDAVIVCILDANNLRRNLFLALELKEKSSHVLLAINMAKEVKNLDAQALESELGMKCFKIDARKKKTLKDLEKAIVAESQSKTIAKPPQSAQPFDMGEFEKKSKRCFFKIDEHLSKAGYKTNGFYGFSRLDKFLLHPFWGFLAFALVMAAVFFVTFGAVGSFLSGLVCGGAEWTIERMTAFMSAHLSSTIFIDFVCKGVLGGVLTVLSFMPQIVLLFLCLNFLEDVGYLSRVALLFDGVFKKLGLTGRSAFSLIMGFGCTTTAIMTTRNLDSTSLKKRTALLLPFMSCSAKLPIYAVICSAFFTKHKALMVFLLYMLGIGLMLLVSLVLKAVAKTKSQETFMLELPKYRLPNFKKVVSNAMKSAGDFFVRVGGILLLASIVVFVLYNFSFGLTYVPLSGDKSILESLAGVLRYLFVPLGFGSVGAVIAILSGLVAKEMVVSSLAIINAVGAPMLAQSLTMPGAAVSFSAASAISFLVFVLLYPPCISAFFSMRREVGTKTAVLSFFLQFAVAYVVSFLTFTILRLAGGCFWWVSVLLCFALAIAVFVVVKCGKKKQACSLEVLKIRCNSCKENCHGNNCL